MSSKLSTLYYSQSANPRKIGVRTHEEYRHERLELRRFDTLKGMLVWLIRHIAKLDSGFLERLDKQDDMEFQRRAHRKRRYFARHLDTLYRLFAE